MRFDSMLESYVLNSTATRHDLDSTARVLSRHVDHPIRQPSPARARSSSPSTRCRVERPRNTPPRTRTWRWRLHERALAPDRRRCPGSRRCTKTSSSRCCQCCSTWSMPACWSMPRCCGGRAARSRGAWSTSSSSTHIARPARASTSIRRSSCRKCCSASSGCRSSARRRRASPRRPRTCSRSSRSSSSCRASSWTTGRCPSSSRHTRTSSPRKVNPRTGRVHTSYHQAVAATGRLSSPDPNLQNIPIRTPEGRRIRQAFVAPPGHLIVAADYSQIELRIMAHLSGDEGLLRAFAEDHDIHQATAAEVFGVDAAERERRPAPRRQGDQLRSHLRHVRVRTCAPARASIAARRRDTSTCTSSAIRA